MSSQQHAQARPGTACWLGRSTCESSVYYKVMWCVLHNSLHQVGMAAAQSVGPLQQQHNSSGAVHCSTQTRVQLGQNNTGALGCMGSGDAPLRQLRTASDALGVISMPTTTNQPNNKLTQQNAPSRLASKNRPLHQHQHHPDPTGERDVTATAAHPPTHHNSLRPKLSSWQVEKEATKDRAQKTPWGTRCLPTCCGHNTLQQHAVLTVVRTVPQQQPDQNQQQKAATRSQHFARTAGLLCGVRGTAAG